MRNPVDVIIKPVVSEKSMDLSSNNKYVFYINVKSNKIEIKNAIEKQFKVKVYKINTINVKGKLKKKGKTKGYRPNRKKAIITLKEGKIELFENNI